MGGNSSKNHGGAAAAARADQGWGFPLVRSLSRSWSMPPVPFSTSSYSRGNYDLSPGMKEDEGGDEEEEEHGDDHGPGEVINPGNPRGRATDNDSWEIVDERPLCSIGKPRKRARSYSKSVSLPHSSRSSRSPDFRGLVHGLPLVLEEETSPNASLVRNSCEKSGFARPPPSPSVKQGLFYGSWLEDSSKSSFVEESLRNRGYEMVSPSSSVEDWCIVGPRKMERLDEACGRKSSGNCLRDKTNFVDHTAAARRDRDLREDVYDHRKQDEQQDRLHLHDSARHHHLNGHHDRRLHKDLKQEQDLSRRLQKDQVHLLDRFERKCPPGGDNRVVLYVTSLQGIRKTYEQCRAVRTLLEVHFARIDERDVAMHAEFRRELRDLVGPMPVPRLFIKGRHIGGADEALQLNENGLLRDLLDGVPKERIKRRCEGCGGARFVPCGECGGSCKIAVVDGEDGGGGGSFGNERIIRCWCCNENGLVRCPLCY